MATPITWRNVDVNPVGEISRAMMSGQSGINAGFDSIANVLKQQQQVNDQNWNQQKTNNTNAFMNEMANYRTPEEYQAALDSGALQARLTASGAQIDQAAARQAMGAQMGILQDRLVKGQQFLDGQQKYTEKDGRDEVAALIAANQPEQAMIRARELGLHDLAPLQKQATETARNKLIQDRTDTTWKRGEELARYTHPAAVEAAKDEDATRNILKLAAAAQQAHQTNVGKVDKENAIIDKNTLGLGMPIEHPGDTKTANAYYDSLVESGQYSPQVLAKAKASILSGFDSTGSGKIGVEAENRKVANAQEDAVMEDLSKNTWSKPGTPHALQNQPALTDLVNKNVEEKYRTLAHRTISKVLTEGIEVKDGNKKVRITPSQADIEAAINNTNDDFWNTQGWDLLSKDFWSLPGGDFGDKIIANLQQRANSASAKEQRNNMEKVNEYRLRKSASEYYSKGAPSNPLNR